jgi:copper chaperone CopZ
MRTITILLMVFLTSAGTFSQKNKPEEVKIKTSSQCEMCKERIEEALAFEKGVKKSELDMESQVVTVIYKKRKTTPEKIRKAISRVGYDADDFPADPKAYSKLPACCKKPEDPDHEKH